VQGMATGHILFYAIKQLRRRIQVSPRVIITKLAADSCPAVLLVVSIPYDPRIRTNLIAGLPSKLVLCG